MSCIFVIQHGTDGFGHQLHGLFTVLALHRVGNIRFAANVFLQKQFKVAHGCDYMQSYLKLCVQQFLDDHPDAMCSASNPILEHVKCASHLTYTDTDTTLVADTDTTLVADTTVYMLDNAYYFDKLKLTEAQQLTHHLNLERLKPYFIRNLPPSRLPPNAIVIHIRMGDAMKTLRRASIQRLNGQLNAVVRKLRAHNAEIRVHTDGPSKLPITGKLVIFDKTEPLEAVLSDLVHATVLICGDSSLSKVCRFLAGDERKLTIVADNNKHSMPTENVLTVSQFLSGGSGGCFI
jgi:hypothetical protein